MVAFKLSHAAGTANLLEDVLVGVFGAVVGANLLVPTLMGVSAADGLRLSALALALGITVAAVVMLHIYRKKVISAPRRKRRRFWAHSE